MNHDTKHRILEEAMQKIEINSVQQTDGTWLEDLTSDVSVLLREWDLVDCMDWDDWVTIQSHFPTKTSKTDMGVDLVATRDSNKLIAIQCKSRQLDEAGSGQQISKHEIDSFMSMTQDEIWEERWIVTNGDNPLAPNALEAQKMVPKHPVKISILSRDVQQELDALRQGTADSSKTKMQNEVVATCVSTLRAHVKSDSGGCPKGEARGRLILPCGTGKTRISLRIVEELTETNSLSVVLCPSIALVAQIRREYLQFATKKIDALAVCSDQTAGITQKDEGVLPENDPTRDTSFVSANEVKGRVTTDSSEIAQWMQSTKDTDRIKVLFGTYQSARTVADALHLSGSNVDVLIADEAHRTAGIRKPPSRSNKLEQRIKDFTLCHDRDEFPAKYRVYQTATPRIYSSEVQNQKKDRWLVRTMDDETVFGVLLARRSYIEAVENGWLCDYRIIAIGVNDDAAFDQANTLASLARSDSVASLKTAHYLRGLSFALAMAGATASESQGNISIGSCIGFMNLTEKSRKMASSLCSPEVRKFLNEWFKKNEIDRKPAEFSLRHLEAKHNVTKRQQALKQLADGNQENPFGILNVGIFGEGTDSPALNAVAFLEPRKSPIDVIQAVGRVMRTAPGKELGYIICPILIPPNVDPEAWLSSSKMSEGWSELGEILLALRAHDGRIETELAHLINVYLPADPVFTRNLVGIVNEDQQIEYYEQEGQARTVYDSVEKVIRKESTPRKEGFVKLKNRSKKSWRVAEPGMMVTGRLIDGEVDVREKTVERTKSTDGTLGVIDLPKCKKSMANMINHQSGTKRKKDAKNKKKEIESAGLRLLRLSDAVGNEKAIKMNLLTESGLKINRVERDLNVLEDSVNEASRHLDADELEPVIAKYFGLDRLKAEKKRASATTVASLIFMNAAMMQSRIDQTGYIDTSRKLVEAQNHPDPIAFLRRCWNKILAHDYRTVFEPAVDLLDVIEEESGRRSGLERALHHIASEAQRIAETYADMGMDHAGPLFNRVMGDQSSDGAFFTRPLAAVLLASLALDLLDDFDWTKEEYWKQLKIVDLACGSGTLLAACLVEMRRRARDAVVHTNQINKLHRVGVEDVLKGFDINPISLQLAAAQLSIGNAEIRFSRMGLHRMPYGRMSSDAQVSAGSLEFFAQPEILPKSLVNVTDEIASDEIWKSSDGHMDSRVTRAVDDAKDANVVIMNPPFTNREKMGEKFAPEDQKALRLRIDALQEIVEKNDLAAGKFADKNSVRPLFTLLADKCLRQEGVLAVIVPTILLSASSGTNERRLLASRYHIHTILTCHRPGQVNMSQNTGINESLIVARKWSHQDTDKPPTRFINLDEFPRNEQEAFELCDKLSSNEELGNHWGSTFFWPASRMETGDWSAGVLRDPKLAEASYNFVHHKDFVPLGSFAGVHVHATGQVLRGSFKQSSAEVSGSFPILKSKGADSQQTLRSVPDEYWIAKAGNDKGEQQKERVLAKAGYLLLTAGQNTQTARLSAVVGTKLVGNSWMPVTGLSIDESKAIGVFLNSTVGRLLLMRIRGKTLSFPTFSATEYSQLVLPNVRTNDRVRDILVQSYEETCDMFVPQFRDGECDVRVAWDKAVANTLGLDGDDLDDLRSRLNKEPSVSGIGYSEYPDANEDILVDDY